MTRVVCAACRGVVSSPSRRVPLEVAVEHHEATCPGVRKVRT